MISFGCHRSSSSDGSPPRQDAAFDLSRPDRAGERLDRGGLDIAMKPDSGTPPGVYTFTVGQRRLELTLLPEDILRVRYLKSTKPWPDRGWTHAISSWPTATLPFQDQGQTLVLRTARLEITLRKSDAGLVLRDLEGQTLSEDLPEKSDLFLPYVRKVIKTDEHFYGLGEKTSGLDKRGQRLTMWNTDPLYPVKNYTQTVDPLYQSVPFVLSLRKGTAHGLYLASTFRTILDLGHTLSTEMRLETYDGDLEYYFIPGPRPWQVVRGFSSIVGRMPMPPLWALGYHQSRWSYYPASEVYKLAAEFRKRGIPCDGLWLDIDYMDGYRSFTWDATRFPNPSQLLSDLDKDGFKVTAIVDPGLKHEPGGTYAAYNQGEAGQHFIKKNDGSLYVGKVWPGAAVFPDFSRPLTRTYWSSLIKDLVKVGLRGAWIDMNEPSTWEPAGFPLEAVHDGEGQATTHKEVHNVYALLMARATREGLAQAAPDARPFVLTRAGFAGIQRYAAVWTGDQESSWDHLAMAMPMMMNMSLSGISFVGTDVGGYSGSPGSELFARWMQLGCISPFFRNHVESGTPHQEPWAFGAQVEAISKAHIELRYRLLPYLYSLMRRASVTGDPVLRPLLYEFPDDETTYGLNTQLMLGPYLMAAPVTFGKAQALRLYLPKGIWFDLHEDMALDGGAYHSVAAPLERLPLLVRGGAILPSWKSQRYVGEKTLTELWLDLYPAPGAPPTSFSLYLDDGQTLAYQKGVYYEQTLTLTTDAQGAVLELGSPSGSYVPSHKTLRLRFHGVTSKPTQVLVGTQAHKELSDPSQLETSDGWAYQSSLRLLHVRLPVQAPVKVSCQYPGSVSPVRKIKVNLFATLPSGSPGGDIYLTTNLHAWTPTSAVLKRQSATLASATLTLDEGTTFEYKYTRGSWATVEKTSTCGEVQNRLLAVKDMGGGTINISDQVLKWADWGCP